MSRSFRRDLTGQRFGRLTVLEFVPTAGKHSFWKCKCDCGNVKNIRSDVLLEGKTISCGCEKKKQDRINLVKNHSHKQSGKRIYYEWQGMKGRCYNSNNERYDSYGGRGIKMCDEWKNDFQAFYDWAMLNGYADDLSIDRIDNSGDYEPSNCRWTDNFTQSRNRRSNIIVDYNGEKMCLTDAAALARLTRSVVDARYHRGDRGNRLFRNPGEDRKNVKYLVEYSGEIIPLTRAAKLSGIPKTTLFRRYHRGDRGERLFRPTTNKNI